MTASATSGHDYVYVRTDTEGAQPLLDEYTKKGYRVHTFERHQQTVDILFERLADRRTANLANLGWG